MEITTFIYIFVVILFFTKILGELAQKFQQPPVFGELIAGILIGPSVLGLIPDPHIFHHNEVFYLFAQIGLLLLLFETGLELSLQDLLKVGKKSFWVGLGGVVLPFVLIIGFSMLTGGLNMEKILIASAFTATSIGITCKLLSELNILGKKEAKVVIGAAIIDDILALSVLGIISALATSSQELNILITAKIIFVSVGFLALAIFFGEIFVKKLIRILEQMRSRGSLTTGAILFALALSLFALEIGSSIVLGAFAAGILLAETHQKETIERVLKPLVDIFTPIFFVSVGVFVNISVFNVFNPANHNTLMWIAVLLVIAVGSKYLSGFMISAKHGLNRKIIGISMVPRGEVCLIFASVGKVSGILSSEMYTAIVATVMLSTIIVPPLMKSFATNEITAQEEKKDEKTEELALL